MHLLKPNCCMQGMNEVLAPLYYVFKLDPTVDFNVEAEADAFWCFHSLMGTLRDVYGAMLSGRSCACLCCCTRRVRNVESAMCKVELSRGGRWREETASSVHLVPSSLMAAVFINRRRGSESLLKCCARSDAG